MSAPDTAPSVALPFLFDHLYRATNINPPLPELHRTNLPLPDPRWVTATLASLKDHGFTFRFFNPTEETMGADGLCQWFKRDPMTGKMVDDRSLRMSRKINSLDALGVAAHELGHVYTLDPDELRVAFTDPLFRQSPGYAEGEMMAEAVAFLVAATVDPVRRLPLLRRSMTYLLQYRPLVPFDLWRKRESLVIDAAYTILTDAAERLETR